VPPTAYTPETADALWATKAEHLQRKRHTAEDAHALVSLLGRILVIVPMERPPASELLHGPYLVCEDLTTTNDLPVENPPPMGYAIVVG
jgi:hypothetical protein